MQNNSKSGRRKFLRNTLTLAAGSSLITPSLFGAPSILKYYNKPNSKFNGVQIGVITYSFRSMEDQSAEATLKYILDCNINAIELIGDPAETFAGRPENTLDRSVYFGLMKKKKSGAISDNEAKELAEIQAEQAVYNAKVTEWRKNVDMKKFEKFRKMYNDAGVQIYAFKPRNTFGKNNSDADIDWGMKTAKVLGASHVTVEHPSNDATTLRLGNFAKKHGIYIAYHGHEQQTPTLWDTALEQSKYNALNLDLGHFVAAGNTAPLEIIKTKHEHIKSMHLKDRQTLEHGKGNLVWGSGDTPLAGALQLMKDKNYTFPGTIELEYDIPQGSNAVAEVQKCVEFCKNALK
ncbi:sugar phosphate isomerase/epimerase [Zobellia sp. 1_MG-2023]|uniref:sugar phosphate isomerase/epimerase family protein n=1 Tax=Zobellia sp. 1_MG-2023 TaxID=3062626 RepID=UPI0026E28D70|nr:TIM barrel protein [Zobellia sp. 1_MG-2023]MDO6818483.1 TIM barrel protein [Zobellia sp. 1_MG-2023]